MSNSLQPRGLQWALKSLLQHHSSEASVLRHSAFLMVCHIRTRLLEKAIALTRQTFVSKVMSLLFEQVILPPWFSVFSSVNCIAKIINEMCVCKRFMWNLAHRRRSVNIGSLLATPVASFTAPHAFRLREARSHPCSLAPPPVAIRNESHSVMCDSATP